MKDVAAAPMSTAPNRGAAWRIEMRAMISAVVMACALLPWSSASAFGLRGFAISNGGSNAAASGTLRLYATAGLPVVGSSQGPGLQVCSGFWCFGGSRVLDVDPGVAEALPAEFSLGRAMPNPARDRTHFDLALPRAAEVTLSVFDVAGRQVGAAVAHRFEAGRHDLTWRAEGTRAGMYFVRVSVDGVVRATRSVVVLR